MQYHKYSITEIESLLPWERALYIIQLEKYIEEENERISKLNQ